MYTTTPIKPTKIRIYGRKMMIQEVLITPNTLRRVAGIASAIQIKHNAATNRIITTAPFLNESIIPDH